ncbi:MAG: hypothetical protein DRH12_14840, partial [Deltaproteobacteria bacterium]
MYIGDRIRMFRQLMGWTQQYAGALLGLKQRSYARLETARRTVAYQERIKDFAMLIGVRSAYLLYGAPPAIAKGWLYYELPPRNLRPEKARITPKALNDLRYTINELFPQFLWEHSVKTYSVGQVSEELRYYNYPIAPEATLTIKASREFIEQLDLVSEKVSLTLEKKVSINDIGEVSEGMNPDDAQTLVKLYSALGIKLWADFLEEFKDVQEKLHSRQDEVEAKALRRLCMMILDLGVDPADVWKEL